MPTSTGLGSPSSPTVTTRLPTNRYPTWEYNLLRGLGGDPRLLPASLEALNRIYQAEDVTPTANNWLAISAPPQYPLTGQSGVLPDNPDYIATFPTIGDGVNGLLEFFRNSTYAGTKNFAKELVNPNATLASIAASMKGGSWGQYDINAVLSGTDTATYQPYVQPGETAVGPGGETAGRGETSFYQCTGATIIGGGIGPLRLNLLNSCQAKALVGGLTVGAGFVLMGAGATILFTSLVARGPIGQTAMAIRGPAGKIGNLFTRPAPSTPTPASAEVFEGVTLSPQQSAYRAEKGDAALSAAFARQRAATQKRQSA